MRNKVIIALVSAAAILTCLTLFVIIPSNQKKQEEYEAAQQDALTHDITAVEIYKSPYIGDTSNSTQIFYKLPLGNIQKKFQIDSDNCTITVYYLDTVWDIGEEKVHCDLVYNAVAAMASIDNMTAVTYEFNDKSFSFTREQIEAVFGNDLSSLLQKEVWQEKVQNKLADNTLTESFY
ncbi:MAG: DUF4825 domain-containing protein [Acutalibacteraceae bacterium]